MKNIYNIEQVAFLAGTFPLYHSSAAFAFCSLLFATHVVGLELPTQMPGSLLRSEHMGAVLHVRGPELTVSLRDPVMLLTAGIKHQTESNHQFSSIYCALFVLVCLVRLLGFHLSEMHGRHFIDVSDAS